MAHPSTSKRPIGSFCTATASSTTKPMPPRNVIEAADELVESMPEASVVEKEGPTITMEERKAKMEQLRAKMVRLPLHSHPPAR